MKLYLIDGTYCGTQAEAKAEAKRVGIKFNATTHEANVPTDKEGLIAYLNGLSRGVYGATPATVPAPLGEIAPMHEPIEQPSMSLEQALAAQRAAVAPSVAFIKACNNTVIDDAILAATFPEAVRIAECANSRVGEHLRLIADAHWPKPGRFTKSEGGLES